MSERKSDKFVRDLQKTGLNYEESMIYFELVQKGPKGDYASVIASTLKMKRTTMLSKLNRLIQKRCARIDGNPLAPRGVRRFVAISPAEYITKIVHQKRQELLELEKLEKTASKQLERMFQQSIEYGQEDLDPFLAPFLGPLLEQGWKLVEQVVELSKISHGFDGYDCTLLPPKAQLIKDCGFLVFKFNYPVESDETTINFITDLLLRRSTGEILQKDIGVKDVRISKTTISFFDRTYPSL